jgi:hypothetical protein
VLPARLRPTASSSIPHVDRLGDLVCGSARSGVVLLRRSHPRFVDVPTSDAVVTAWLSHAGSQPACNPVPALRSASVFRSVRSPRVRRSRTSPFRRRTAARRTFRHGVACAARTSSSCRSRGARSRACEPFLHFWSLIRMWFPVLLSPAPSRSTRVSGAANRSRSHFCVFAIVRNSPPLDVTRAKGPAS